MFKWMVWRFSLMYIVVFFAVTSLRPRDVKADLFVEVQNATLMSGGFGSIDVLVSSMGGTDTFSLFNYQFKITPINIVNGGFVEFQSSFSSADTHRQSNSEQNELDYIFAGATDAGNFVSVRPESNSLLLDGSDERLGGNMDLSGPTKYLLARLELQHITISPELSGGTFRVSLVESPALSYFENSTPLVGQLQPRIHDNSYTLGSGIVTIISAVPEPSSLSLVAISLCLAWRRRRA